MYVCQPCIEEYKLEVDPLADESTGDCEVCQAFLRESRGFEVAWVVELERPFAPDDPGIVEQLRKLGRIL